MLKFYLNKIYNLFKEDFNFIIGNYSLRIASLAFTLLIAKKVDPEHYGIFGLGLLLATYSGYFNFGAQFSINKELSVDIQNKKIISYGIVNSLIFFVLIIILSFLIKVLNIYPEIHKYLIYIILYSGFYNISEISNGILRSTGSSKQLAKVKMVSAIGTILITIYFLIVGIPESPFPFFLKWIVIVTFALITSVYLLSKSFSLRFTFNDLNKSFVKYMLAQGLLLSAYITIDSFTKTIDRLFISIFYTNTELGLYTFGVSISGPTILAITSIMYMDFSRALKKLKNCTKQELINVSHEILKKLLVLFFIILFFSTIVIYFVLKFYLPNYFPSIVVIVLYLINYIPRFLIFPYTSYLVANNLNTQLLGLIILPNIINIGISFFVAYYNFPYYYLLIVTFPSNIIYYLLLRNYIFNLIKKENDDK